MVSSWSRAVYSRCCVGAPAVLTNSAIELCYQLALWPGFIKRQALLQLCVLIFSLPLGN